jgi:hypothetical protein
MACAVDVLISGKRPLGYTGAATVPGRESAMTDDNSELFAQRRVCLDCEETFTLGEMYPGKCYTDPMQCPYCRGDKTALEVPHHS